MGRKPINDKPEFFDTRMRIGGDRGQEIIEIVANKMKADHRKTIPETVAAIILEYGEMKMKKKTFTISQ